MKFKSKCYAALNFRNKCMNNGDAKAIRSGNYLLILVSRTLDAFVTEGIEITIMKIINSMNNFVLQVCHSKCNV